MPKAAAGYSKRSRLDKLGVKPGRRVAVVGLRDAAFLAELRERAVVVRTPRAGMGLDIVFQYADEAADLPRLSRARAAIVANGAVWAIWPKGRKQFREDDIRAFGPRAGLVDVKVVAFSETLSGLKLVIPVAQRG